MAKKLRTFAEFNAVASDLLTKFGAKADRSTFNTTKSHPLSVGRRKDYWLEASARKRHWDSDRTAGYLAAYVKFFGRAFPGEGIPTQEGYVQLDKGVMCALLVGECVKFKGASFELTGKGQALIAPFVRFPG